MSDYLWDASAPRDAEVERLERALGRYRLDTPAPMPEWLRDADVGAGAPISARYSLATRGMRTARRRVPRVRALVAAAAVVVALVGLVARVRTQPWRVTTVTGRARIGPVSLDAPRALRTGEWLETDAASSARRDVGRIGRAAIGPASRGPRVRAAGPGHRRPRGTMRWCRAAVTCTSTRSMGLRSRWRNSPALPGRSAGGTWRPCGTRMGASRAGWISPWTAAAGRHGW